MSPNATTTNPRSAWTRFQGTGNRVGKKPSPQAVDGCPVDIEQPRCLVGLPSRHRVFAKGSQNAGDACLAIRKVVFFYHLAPRPVRLFPHASGINCRVKRNSVVVRP